MRRHLLSVALVAVAGLLMTATDAQACHKKKCKHTPAPVCEVAPVVYEVCPPVACEPAPVCKPKKKCGLLGGHKKKMKKAHCAAPVVETCATPAYAYAAPQAVYAAPQGTYAAPQTPYTAPAPQAPTKG